MKPYRQSYRCPFALVSTSFQLASVAGSVAFGATPPIRVLMTDQTVVDGQPLGPLAGVATNARGDVAVRLSDIRGLVFAVDGELHGVVRPEDCPTWQDGVGFWPVAYADRGMTDRAEVIVRATDDLGGLDYWAVGPEGYRPLVIAGTDVPWDEYGKYQKYGTPDFWTDPRGSAIGVRTMYQHDGPDGAWGQPATYVEDAGVIEQLRFQGDDFQQLTADVLPLFVLGVNPHKQMIVAGWWFTPDGFWSGRNGMAISGPEGGRPVAHERMPAPGLEGLTFLRVPQNPQWRDGAQPQAVALSESGAVSFDAVLSGPDGKAVSGPGWLGMFEWRDGEIRLIARSGDPVEIPGRDGITLAGGSIFFSGRYAADQLYFLGTAVSGSGDPLLSRGLVVWRGTARPENLVFSGVGPGPDEWMLPTDERSAVRFASGVSQMVLNTRHAWMANSWLDYGILTVDLDPATQDAPITRLAIGDAIDLGDGTPEVVDDIELLGVTDDGVVSVSVLCDSGRRAIVQFDLKAGPADANVDGEVTQDDIAAFIGGFLNGDIAIADLTGDGVLDNGDLIAFVNAYLDAG